MASSEKVTNFRSCDLEELSDYCERICENLQINCDASTEWVDRNGGYWVVTYTDTFGIYDYL